MVLRPTAPLLLLALALGACEQQGTTMMPYDMAKTVHVDRVRVQHSLSFAPGSAELRGSEAMALETFIDQSGVKPNDRVFLAVPSGDPLAGARTARIASLLSRRGIDTQEVPAPASGVAPNHVLVLVDRYIAKAPACPDWSGSPETSHENLPGSNFGCATTSNLAEMIDNPRDLVRGRSFGPFAAEPTIGAVTRYRTETVKPLLSVGPSTGGAGGASQGSSGMSSGGASTGGAASQ
jgi:pilus assembly protein CpaD